MPVDVAPLFQPVTIGTLALKSRIVMAPMTRSFSPDGIPGPNVAAYYRRRAEHDVGLIITEGTLVGHPAAGNDVNVPHFYGEAALSGWSRVVAEVHAAAGRIMPQLWHVGTMRRHGDGPNVDVPPISPSGLFKPGRNAGEAASIGDIEVLVASFAEAAAAARRLGFDGVEIHGAHGYLIDQFFWAGTNERTDAYGGGIAQRGRFAAEIIAACRRATAPDFPIVLRFSQWKQQDYAARLATTPSELATFLAPLVDAGVDIFHCSNRRFWEPEFEGSDMNLAGWTRKISGKPVITVGSVGLDTDFIQTFAGQTAGPASRHLERLVDMMNTGEVDLVAVGRALIGDPAWAAKLHSGQLATAIPFTREALARLE